MPGSDSRNDILARLRAQQREDQSPPPVWRSRRRFADLAERFTQSLTDASGEVIRANSFDAALQRLEELLQSLGVRRVVANNEPSLNTANLTVRWPDLTWFIVGHSEGDLRAFCATADVGLSSGDAALAETGSILVTSGPGKSRLATLLPPVHLVLIPTSRLTADIFTWTAARQEPPPASMTLISGPSKTADIEQTLTVGVHGPKRFIVILYED